MMGVVTELSVQLIAKQVDEKGLVVWYDPEQAYGAAAAELSLPNTTVARYEGSFFKLRNEIDHLLNDVQPPRLVVYVPLERTETDSALIELDCAGVDHAAPPTTSSLQYPAVGRGPQCPQADSGRGSGCRNRAAGRGGQTFAGRSEFAGRQGKRHFDWCADADLRLGQPARSCLGIPAQRPVRRGDREEGSREGTASPAASQFRHRTSPVRSPVELARSGWGGMSCSPICSPPSRARRHHRSPLSPWPPARAASMPACDWLEHGETAGMCGTAMWPRPTRSNRTLPSASLTCP